MPDTTLKRQKGADKELPAEVRLVGTFGGGFVLTDAEHFDASFVLTPSEFVTQYGGNPDLPASENEITQARANKQNAGAVRSYTRGDTPPPSNLGGLRKHVASEGRPPTTPEEVFSAEADNGHDR